MSAKCWRSDAANHDAMCGYCALNARKQAIFDEFKVGDIVTLLDLNSQRMTAIIRKVNRVTVEVDGLRPAGKGEESRVIERGLVIDTSVAYKLKRRIEDVVLDL